MYISKLHKLTLFYDTGIKLDTFLILKLIMPVTITLNFNFYTTECWSIYQNIVYQEGKFLFENSSTFGLAFHIK